MNNPPRIFISYVRKDRAHAEMLYSAFETAGHRPVMDTKNIPGGAEWFEFLDDQISRADFFLACLSHEAVAVENGFQRQEIAQALAIWEEEKKGKRQVYLIPIRFEDCGLLAELDGHQWVDCFVAEDTQTLLRTVEAEISRVRRLSLKAPAATPTASAQDASQQSEEQLWCNIVYINARASGPTSELPPEFGNLREWMWGRGAHGRWSCIEWDVEQPPILPRADLLVFEWSAQTSIKAKSVYAEIERQSKEQARKLPILLIVDEGRAPEIEELASASRIQEGGPFLGAITVAELNHWPKIEDVFDKLHLLEKLPKPTLQLHYEVNDWETQEIIEWIKGPDHLKLALQKFFPQAQDVSLQSFQGNWETPKLCRLIVEEEEQDYLLSLFDERIPYETALNGHLAAGKWLGDAVLPLREVPAVNNPHEPFRFGVSRLYPLCFALDLPDGQDLSTFKECYGSQAEVFIEASFVRLLAVLAPRQPLSFHRVLPWGDKGISPFVWTAEQRRQVLAALSDLRRYGEHLDKQQQQTKWDECAKMLETLADRRLPRWLKTRLDVATGPIHGNPVPQNCLVNPRNAEALKLIGCGNFLAQGRLVSDLALIERDLKLVLLGTDADAEGYLDWEVSQLPEWQRVEAHSVGIGINYTLKDLQTLQKTLGSSQPLSGPVQRAYKLIAAVRQQAQRVSATTDSNGHHYFAALLYWTLDSLRSPQVRPTKKLLALLSAAEILSEQGKRALAGTS